MKKAVFSLIIVLSAAVFSYAQTPEEIVRRMSAQFEKCEQQGYSMDFSMKMPVIGTVVTHVLTRGDRMRMDIARDGKKATTWVDETTSWDYDYADNEVTISKKEVPPVSDGGSLSKYEDLADGYKLILKNESDKAWYIKCKKKSSNKEKSDLNELDLVVSKADYLPLRMSGGNMLIKIAIENVKMGVTEKDVTFNAADWPGVTITDKR